MRMPFTFYQPTPPGADRLHTAPPPLRSRPLRSPGTAIKTLSIRYGQGFGMAQAIQALERGGFNVMILTYTKISTSEYCFYLLG